jgi:O-acetyl-ADP-ribose deacetylase (regulator of RNase III)
MIAYVKASLFESPAKVLVNTVNTVGVMGKGIAKTFKEIHPEMFRQYQELCERKQFQVGKLWLFKTDHKWILNFPTKVHWRQSSKPEYIEEGLKTFVSSYSGLGIASAAFPRLGCGNGELDWDNVVHPLMTKYLGNLAIDVFIYHFDEDYARPEHRDIDAMTAWLRSEPRTLAFSEMWTDLSNLNGQGIRLRTWDGVTDFTASLTTQPGDGLVIQASPKSIRQLLTAWVASIVPRAWRPQVIAPSSIFVPQEAMLDLWQNIRAYGFCVPRIMPAGLDVFAPYVLALLSGLDYLKPVELSIRGRTRPSSGEAGLRLYAPPVNSLTSTSKPVYTVHPV